MRMIRFRELIDVCREYEAVVFEGLVPDNDVLAECGFHLVHVK